ncbi:MAG: 30S ribosomal protein S8 [Deltaproteobacteria bacterium RIFOXYA12_FULL_61_11]|nr:MAG: 30S ribosomal protein S8 [Deltaproteobacteria bacterium RIFOXYA12_FULL_61_11]
MSMTDPIADLLTRIRNATIARHQNTYCPRSNLKESIVRILRDEGYLRDYGVEEVDGKPYLNIALKYYGHNKNVISTIQRESKPGRRVYISAKDIPTVRNGYGIAILSTPKGLMTNKQAMAENVGGELLLTVW